MTEKTWFTAQAVGDGNADIHIYEEIGAWGITANDFNKALRDLGPVSNINLYINSPGGSVFDGIGIYNMLKRHRASVTVTVDGIAASIASLIAMAGDEVIMPSNAMMMIHDPSGFVVGTSKEMRDIANALDKMKTNMVNAYVAKSGLLRDEDVRQMMEDETWMTAEEAVDYGFADRMTDEILMAANFDLSRFRHPPEELEGISNRGNATQHGDVSMTTRKNGTQAETPEEMEARIRAEVTAELEAKAAAEAKKDPQPQATTSTNDDDVEARVRNEVAEVQAMCNLAGRPEAAAEFIAKGTKPAQVLAELNKLKNEGDNGTTTASALRTQSPTTPQNQQATTSGLPDKAVTTLDDNDIWAKWNNKKRVA